MTIRDLLGVIRTRWRLIALCMLVVIGATAGTTIVTRPVYEATARIYLETEKAGNDRATGSYAITQKDLNTYVAILGSPAVQDPLRERLGLAPGTELNVGATVAELTNMLDITAQSSDPQLAHSKSAVPDARKTGSFGGSATAMEPPARRSVRRGPGPGAVTLAGGFRSR